MNFFAFPRNDEKVRIYSESMNELDLFNIKTINKLQPAKYWKNYVRGVFHHFGMIKEFKTGMNIYFSSNIPIGAGMSSSAALELGIFSTLERIHNLQIEDLQAIKTCWKVENEFVGVKCGIMDQFIIRKGKRRHGILLNCDNLEFDYIALPDQVEIIVLDTGIKRNLTEAPYNERINECEAFLQEVNNLGLKVSAISHLDMVRLAELRDKIQTNLYKRALHVVTENQRVDQFRLALNDNNLTSAGKILYESHESLKNNFQASWKEADKIVSFAKEIDGVFGARMHGAGWGGTVLLFVDTNHTHNIPKRFNEQIGSHQAKGFQYYHCSAHDGVKTDIIDPSSIPQRIYDFLTQDGDGNI
jgi:galactokinase